MILELVFLIAVDRVDEKVCEVIEQMQLVVNVEGTRVELSPTETSVVLRRQAPAEGVATVGGIERPEIIGNQAI